MTDPADYTARIRAKGLDTTGVTEQLATEMYRNKGRHYMAIVEVKVDETHEKADGTRKVDLILTQVEPATAPDLAEHLRELTRTLHFNRGIEGGQPTLDDDIAPKVSDILAAGAIHRPHPFLPDDVAKDQPICDLCGGIEASAVHMTQDFLPDGDDGEDDGEDEPASDTCPTPACVLNEGHDGDHYIQAGDEPTVGEVTAARERALISVPDPFTPTA